MMFEKSKNVNKCKSGGVTLHKNAGKFYSAYDIDAYIMNIIFGYKVIEGMKCGFPDNALNKVLQKLEESHVNYQIINKDEKIVIKDFKKINKYDEFCNMALKLIEKQNKIDVVVNKIKSLSKENLDKVIEMILNVQD